MFWQAHAGLRCQACSRCCCCCCCCCCSTLVMQAGVYPNAINAATSILNAAGVRGLFTVRQADGGGSHGPGSSCTSGASGACSDPQCAPAALQCPASQGGCMSCPLLNPLAPHIIDHVFLGLVLPAPCAGLPANAAGRRTRHGRWVCGSMCKRHPSTHNSMMVTSNMQGCLTVYAPSLHTQSNLRCMRASGRCMSSFAASR